MSTLYVWQQYQCSLMQIFISRSAAVVVTWKITHPPFCARFYLTAVDRIVRVSFSKTTLWPKKCGNFCGFKPKSILELGLPKFVTNSAHFALLSLLLKTFLTVRNLIVQCPYDIHKYIDIHLELKKVCALKQKASKYAIIFN